MKFGNLNFLEPSGPLQACNGTACDMMNSEIREAKKEVVADCVKAVT
jgi:hypothetical protein